MTYQEVTDQLLKIFKQNTLQLKEYYLYITFSKQANTLEVISIRVHQNDHSVDKIFIFFENNSTDYLQEEYKNLIKFLDDQKFIDSLEDNYFII